MTLADDIRALRDRVLADLNAAHDNFTDTIHDKADQEAGGPAQTCQSTFFFPLFVSSIFF